MKKIYLNSIFCVCMALLSCTKEEQLVSGNIEGRVISFNTGEPLSNVTVQILDGGSSETDSDGRFHFADMLAGIYTLSFSKSGYPAATREVNVPEGQTVSCDVALTTDPDFEIVNGVLTVYQGRGGVVVIPEGVTGIGTSVFQGNKAVTSVIIPEGVESIGDEAFEHCEYLVSIRLPNSLVSIGARSFASCYRLSSPIIPDGVTFIGASAFSSCYLNMVSVTLGKNVEHIGSMAFAGCFALVAFVVAAENSHYSAAENGVLFNREKTTLVVYPGAKARGYTVPNTVATIGDNAFNGCIRLTSVIVPGSVTHIGDRAFANCTRLTSINIPNSVVTIGAFAFSPCESLTSVTMGNGVAVLGDNAFQNCSKLTSVKLSGSLVAIGDYVFENCSELASIIIPEGVTRIGEDAFSGCTELASIAIPNSVVSIGTCAFVDCYSIVSLRIGKGVTFIGEGAFANSASLTSVTVDAENSAFLSDNNVVFNKSKSTLVFCSGSRRDHYTIPSSVTTIGPMAFGACLKLTAVTIPSSVTNIGNAAFGICSKLTSVTVAWGTPIKIPNNTFQDTPMATSGTLRVSAGTRAAYLAADVWGNFKTIVEY
ncbi:MAG: leucine-rich repeat protein [Prevotellaceae bacterium]|jgi:hypothetical protein|nr:leucine-rich repeat protein [Prevotellaceae bacterium]